LQNILKLNKRKVKMSQSHYSQFKQSVYNPHEQSTFSQHYTGQSSMQKSSLMVFGRGDEERVAKELEKQARLERIKAVRTQETMQAQSTV